MSLVLGVRIVCDGPDCDNPTSPGEVCSTRIDSMDGWITREQNGAIHHFCENGCEMGWLTAIEPDSDIEEEDADDVQEEEELASQQLGRTANDLILREMVFRKGEEDLVAVRDRFPPANVDMTNMRSFVAQSYGESLEPAWSGERDAPVQVGWTTQVPPEALRELSLTEDESLEMVVIPMVRDPDTGERVSVRLRMAEQRHLFEQLSREQGVPMTTVTLEERPWVPDGDGK